jgi:hypothetical protein
VETRLTYILPGHPSSTESKTLGDFISSAKSTASSSGSSEDFEIHSLLENDLGAALPLHISLSRTLVLKTSERDPFLEQVTSNVRNASIMPFNVTFKSLIWYPNNDKTRWFLSLGANQSKKDELNRLLHACNATVSVFGQPTLYLSEGDSPQPKKRPREENERNIPDCSKFFHVSLAWSLTPPFGHPQGEELITEDIKHLSVKFNCIKVKVGNTVNTVALPPKAKASESLILR